MSDYTERNLVITNLNNLEAAHKVGTDTYEYYKRKVPKSFEDSNLQIAIYEIPPKKSGYPYHYHLKNEEVFFILSGEGQLQSNETCKKITKGDIIVCPPEAEGAHILTNISETESLTYFEVDVVHYPDVIMYPRSNKVGIIEKDLSKIFFKKDTEVDYYESE